MQGIDKRFKSTRIGFMILFSLLQTAAVLSVLEPASAGVRPGATLSGGNLTLEAKDATIGELLEALSRTAAMDIFVAPGFQASGQRISLRITGEPLEEALRRVLRGYNYAAIYEKEGNDFRIAAIRIYPEGQTSGAVVPLYSGGRSQVYEEKGRRGETMTVLVTTAGEMLAGGGPAAGRGAVGPSQSGLTAGVASGEALATPWVALQFQLEQEEARRFNELLLLRRQAEAADGDPKRRQALALVYADEVAKFQAFRNANRSKVESVKRIGLLGEVSR